MAAAGAGYTRDCPLVRRPRLDRAAAIEEAIATFIIDWPILIVLGAVFAWPAPQERWWRSTAFRAGAIVAGIFTAIALISYVVAPDWMWMYLVRGDVPDVVVVWIALGYLTTFVVAFAAVLELRAWWTPAAWWIAAWGIVSELLLVGLLWERYHLIGTRAEWMAGRAHELLSVSPSGPARTVGLLGPVFLLALAVALWAAWRQRHAAAAHR